MNKKKICFLTGTRADFSKIKSLIKITQDSDNYEVHIFATGMHMNSKYGKTVDEIKKAGFKNIFQFINHDTVEHMDRTLAKTIDGFSHYAPEVNPDLIIIHGDRVEALAGAIVGSLNNIIVAHIEGGEISGTIDESIRHSISKLSHIHLVANKEAKKRLIQLGEFHESIHVLGSPDLDLMNPKNLPDLDIVKQYYEIKFDDFSMAMFHPVTTEYENIHNYVKEYIDALIESELNYVLIFPNNDIGSNEILHEYRRVENNKHFRIFPSLRFEYFLRLLSASNFIIGNSSAGIREAPFYDVPTVDIGTRQNNRAKLPSIYNCEYSKNSILEAIKKLNSYRNEKNQEAKNHFGDGNSDRFFLKLLNSGTIWNTSPQKQFQDIE